MSHLFLQDVPQNLVGSQWEKAWLRACYLRNSWRWSQASGQFVNFIAVGECFSDHNALSDDISKSSELRITLRELLSELRQIMDRRNGEIHRINNLLGIISFPIIITATHK